MTDIMTFYNSVFSFWDTVYTGGLQSIESNGTVKKWD